MKSCLAGNDTGLFLPARGGVVIISQVYCTQLYSCTALLFVLSILPVLQSSQLSQLSAGSAGITLNVSEICV